MKNIVLILTFTVFMSCQEQVSNKNKIAMNNTTTKNWEYATFGGGCFWCTEAIFEQLKGVGKVLPGYSGGAIKNPSYREVCTGRTGHAEVIHIQYDPKEVSFESLLEVFFATHNPTTLNQQGADKGTQYRSAIFYHTENQKQLAEAFIAELTLEKVYDAPIVTEVTPFDTFYEAEDYHQNYYENNKEQAYCRAVINPKLKKFLAKFSDKLK